jgi:hypothetical protein
MGIPGSANLLMLGGEAQAYQIDQSLRFNSADSAYFNLTTNKTPTNENISTTSFWVKRGALGSSNYCVFGCSPAGTLYGEITFGNHKLQIQNIHSSGGGSQHQLISNDVFRDASAWYHIVVMYDTTQATASNRTKVYVNNRQITSWSTETYLGQNQPPFINSGQYARGIGKLHASYNYYFDGCLAEFHHVDGTALDPSSFGEFDDNGVWRPIGYTGSHGTNGFYLKFESSGIGTDSSGNGNNFTPSGFATSGTGTDVMSDTPTTNWCTFNPAYASQNNAGNQFSEGNLKYDSAGTAWRTQVPTFGSISSGKWYWEWSVNTVNAYIGIIGEDVNTVTAGDTQVQSGTILYYSADGSKRIDNVASSYGSAYNNGGSIWSPTVGVALDKDNNTITFYRNGTTQGTINLSSSSLVNKPVRPAFLIYNGTSYGNFGQFAFQYTPPTGYKALNTSNLSAPDIADGSEYFNTVLYTGTGATLNVTGLGFSPDLVWTKNRSSVNNNRLYDVLRGTTKELYSNTTDAETTDANSLTAFNSDGFTLGSSSGPNNNGSSYVAWAWDAGGTGSSNTAGSITSTVSANPTAGFSIVTYTGTGANATVGHGLGVAPSMIIVKNKIDTSSWQVYHSALGATKVIFLESTQAALTSSVRWNDTAPTSTVFTIGTDGGMNGSSDGHVAYCFAEVEGYSKFGSYTGNGSTDGPFVWCGFRPAVVLTKCSSNAGDDWRIWDNQRPGYNLTNLSLAPNTSATEDTSTNNYAIDTLSNGFKLRSLTTGTNGSGRTYIFMALAENPFGGSGVSPANAR